MFLFKDNRALVASMLLVSVSAGLAADAPTEGTLEFRVTTQPNDGNYSPRHVLAIWVANGQNAFVKTLLRRADRRQQYLYTWQGTSQGSTVDAVTGATLSTHQSHTVTWDSRDLQGNLVPDGEYRVRVEYTSEHAQGPITPATYVAFTKGTNAVRLTPANLTYFTSMSLTYTPDVETHVVVAKGSAWRYRDDGVDLHASDWKAAGYDATGWKEGPGSFGFGDAATTPLDFGSDASNKYPAYYFRREFDLDFMPTSFALRIRRDDGAVVYLNGVEVVRENMPTGSISYATLASASVDGANETIYFLRALDPADLVVGRNVLAVELHQSSVTSSDAGFDLELKSTPPTSNPIGFLRGDSDVDGSVTIADAIQSLGYLFQAGPVPGCLAAGDANDDGTVDISDSITILLALFEGAAIVPPPFPECGSDPTASALPCGEPGC